MQAFHVGDKGKIVTHAIRIDGYQGRFSVWYDADGSVYDAEQVDNRGRVRYVKPNGPAWGRLQARYPSVKAVADMTCNH